MRRILEWLLPAGVLLASVTLPADEPTRQAVECGELGVVLVERVFALDGELAHIALQRDGSERGGASEDLGFGSLAEVDEALRCVAGGPGLGEELGVPTLEAVARGRHHGRGFFANGYVKYVRVQRRVNGRETERFVRIIVWPSRLLSGPVEACELVPVIDGPAPLRISIGGKEYWIAPRDGGCAAALGLSEVVATGPLGAWVSAEEWNRWNEDFIAGMEASYAPAARRRSAGRGARQAAMGVSVEAPFCLFGVPAGMERANAEFRILIAVRFDEEGVPMSIEAQDRWAVENGVVSEAEIRSCLERWRILGLPPASRVFVSFDWRHNAGGWWRMRVSHEDPNVLELTIPIERGRTGGSSGEEKVPSE